MHVCANRCHCQCPCDLNSLRVVSLSLSTFRHSALTLSVRRSAAYPNSPSCIMSIPLMLTPSFVFPSHPVRCACHPFLVLTSANSPNPPPPSPTAASRPHHTSTWLPQSGAAAAVAAPPSAPADGLTPKPPTPTAPFPPPPSSSPPPRAPLTMRPAETHSSDASTRSHSSASDSNVEFPVITHANHPLMETTNKISMTPLSKVTCRSLLEFAGLAPIPRRRPAAGEALKAL